MEIRFQPIVSLRYLSLLGVEALARLRDKNGRIWSPNHFVPIVERSGLSAVLAERAAARAIEGFAGGFGTESKLWLSINLPLDVFLEPGSITMVAGYAEKFGVAPERIIIELTESQPVEDVPQLVEALSGWHAQGFRVALDDITPETPNLPQLLQLPFAVVKLDLSVTAHIGSDPSAEKFVRDVVAAVPQTVEIIAEGVESEQIASRLRELGVDLAQGFLISRPMRGMMLPAWWYMWLN